MGDGTSTLGAWLWLKTAREWCEKLPPRTFVLLSAGFVAVQAFGLLALQQPPICTCGYVKFWHGVVLSAENSQQLTDWYTFSHVIHGFLFYFILWLIAPKSPVGLRFAIAVGLEVSWEIIENSPFIIDRYRETALAQGYFGDSVINSVADTLAAALGFILARILPVWVIVGLTIGLELFVAYTIRDNLTLNIIQLIFQNEAISGWQSGM